MRPGQLGTYQKEFARPWELTIVPYAVDCSAGSLMVDATGAATEREEKESSSSSGCHRHSWKCRSIQVYVPLESERSTSGSHLKRE